MRAYEKFANVFNMSRPDHPNIDFVTEKGTQIILKWEKGEYRAYKRTQDDRLSEMMLGSVIPDNLKDFIMDKF